MTARPPYLLDTTVLIDVSRRREPATTWLGAVLRGPGDVCVSAVTIAEFFAGVPPKQRRHWQAFFSQLAHCDVTQDIATRAGVLRYDLARQGRGLLIPDVLIAATAVTLGAALVTANVKDFVIPGLTTIRLGP